MMKRFTATFGLCLVSLSVHAKIYSYVDSDGLTHYSDSKPDTARNYKSLDAEKPKGTFSSVNLNTPKRTLNNAVSAPKEKDSARLTASSEPAPSLSAAAPAAEPPSNTTCLYVSADNRSFSDEPIKGSVCKRMIRTRPKTYFADLKRLPLNKPKYIDLVSAAASRHQVPESLVHAVIRAESAYNANAVSSAGAVGLMQLMPDTARRYGVFDRTDPAQNIDGGTHYLKDLLAMFNNNIELAVAGYNAGEGAVMRYNNTIPPYRETQNYVQQVLKNLRG